MTLSDTNPRDQSPSVRTGFINVTTFLIITVAVMAWPTGYGLGVILRPEVSA